MGNDFKIGSQFFIIFNYKSILYLIMKLFYDVSPEDAQHFINTTINKNIIGFVETDENAGYIIYKGHKFGSIVSLVDLYGDIDMGEMPIFNLEIPPTETPIGDLIDVDESIQNDKNI